MDLPIHGIFGLPPNEECFTFFFVGMLKNGADYARMKIFTGTQSDFDEFWKADPRWEDAKNQYEQLILNGMIASWVVRKYKVEEEGLGPLVSIFFPGNFTK